jgi:hypothetical protein
LGNGSYASSLGGWLSGSAGRARLFLGGFVIGGDIIVASSLRLYGFHYAWCFDVHFAHAVQIAMEYK